MKFSLKVASKIRAALRPGDGLPDYCLSERGLERAQFTWLSSFQDGGRSVCFLCCFIAKKTTLHSWIQYFSLAWRKESNMYALYKQTHPPSGVEHCIYCNFYSPKECNLVVVGTTQLRVYKLNNHVEVSAVCVDFTKSCADIHLCFSFRVCLFVEALFRR